MDETKHETLEESDSSKSKSGVEEPIIRLKTKPIPIIIVLFAAAIASVTSIMQGLEFGEFLVRLIRAICIFGFIGVVIKVILDLFFNNKNQVADGNVEIKTDESSDGEESETGEDIPSDEDNLSLDDEESLE